MITIAPLESVRDLHECEHLQKAIWGFEEISVIPHHLMLTAVTNGGLALGAFEGPQMIGFLFGFPGLERGKLKHCSMICGVLPDKRFQGVGYDLKLAQREAVIRQGLDLITWTFDPLQSPNANFNFRKLGVIAHRYERNLYGSLRDRLNQGLETDRLTVEWWIKSPRVRTRVQQKTYPSSESIMADTETVNHTIRRQGFLVNREYSLTHEAPQLLVEVPFQIHEMKEKKLELVQRWRAETREIFEAYLHRGYVVSEFATLALAGEKRGFYLMELRESDAILERT